MSNKPDLWTPAQGTLRDLADSERRAHDAVGLLIASIKQAQEEQDLGALKHTLQHTKAILGPFAKYYFEDPVTS